MKGAQFESDNYHGCDWRHFKDADLRPEEHLAKGRLLWE